MAAFFASASSQSLVNASPAVLDYPFSVGMWVNATTTGTERTVFCLSDTGTTNNYLRLRQSSASQFGLVGAAGGADVALNIAGLSANKWTFWLVQFVSSIDRSLSVVRPDLGVFTANSSDACAPTGMDTINIGCRNTSAGASQFFDGLVGEFWITNTDIEIGDNDVSTILKVAYGGPFSVPRIAKDIIEYRSFRKGTASSADEIGEVFHGAAGRQVWTNTNGVTIGHHPPLPYWYAKPPNAQFLMSWQNLLPKQNWGPHDEWPPDSDFLQPEMYVTRGTQRF